MAPQPSFDTEQVREKARKDLLYLLEGVRGKKNLVIEKNLAGPLGVIVKASTLRDYGVDNFFFLENDNTDTSQRNVVFIARGECGRHAHAIADQIRRLQRESQSPHEFHVFWVPRRTLLSNKVLEEAGVLGDTTVAELPLFFFPLEKDVLSLELDDAFRDLYLAKDPTPVFLLSKALMEIQQKHGLFPRIIGKGENAKRVAELLSRMRQELLAGEDANETDKIGLTPSTTTESVIIIDREVDFVTPLLTQLTYEGLVDEVFTIQHNQTDVDSTIVGASPQAPGAAGAASAATPTNGQGRKRKIQLDASDKLYEQLRDMNFAVVGPQLNKVARRLKGDYESRHTTKTTAELTEFVKKLPGYQAEQQSLKIHTGLAEEIMKYTQSDTFEKILEVQQNLAAGADPSSQFEAIEELIARDAPLPLVLRLLCVYSCISGGIKTKEFDHFRRLVLQGYGYQHLLTLHNLEKLQMFLSRSSPLASMIPMTGSPDAAGTKTNYTYLRKQLRLIVDEVNESDPNDIAYVYSGYAPLSIRLVQCVLQKQYLLSITRGNGVTGATPAGSGAQGWRGFDDAIKHARGPTFDEVQKGEDKAVKARALLSGGGDKKTVFVVFVGGVSFTEIAALRFLAKQEQARRNIVICTTSIISGNRMMDAAIEKAVLDTRRNICCLLYPFGIIQEMDTLSYGTKSSSASATTTNYHHTSCYISTTTSACHRGTSYDTLDMMGTGSRTRPGQAKTSSHNSAKGSLKDGLNGNDSHNSQSQNHRSRPTRSSATTSASSLANISNITPSVGSSIANSGPPARRGSRDRDSMSSSEDIAAEIVVWTETMNDTTSLDSDSPSSPLSDVATPAPESIETVEAVEMALEPIKSSEPASAHPLPTLTDPVPDIYIKLDPTEDNAIGTEAMDLEPAEKTHVEANVARAEVIEKTVEPKEDVEMQDVKPPAVDIAGEQAVLPESSHSAISEPSDSSSMPPASPSSKATTPIDVDSSKDAPTQVSRPAKPADAPRRRYNVRPKVSIPPEISLAEYAMECISAAESSRLNPYALHQEEYVMLQDHISHAQVTTYLNIRNGILRLWVRNPQIAVTREEAVGCAKDTRWFDVASVCFDWLVRRGYINFGQLEGLFTQYAKKFREKGEEPPRVVLLEGRSRVGGRVYSRPFTSKPKVIPEAFEGKRFTAEMGGMIITGFERGNPINILVRGQLGLPYRPLRPDTTLYDSNGKPVDLQRDQLVEKLYNDCLDRVSEYKFKQPTSKLIEGNRELMDEGKDSSSEAHKTIRQAEESTAAQPHSLPVAEQSITPQVNLVPVSSDRATGRIHTEPGTPGALKAAFKAKLMGWALKQGVSESDDLNIEPLTKEPNATLGSVTDAVIAQYKDLVDLTAQDYRLINWHVANLEYSNATNYHQLSLQGWDIDAGNEWEGHHTMVIGGYQSVPRGLLQFPTPLNIRQKSPVCKITYATEGSTGPAIVECEDGYKVEADFVVNTIPLGVLKHGSIKFEPALPSWKSEAIGRLGFGVLNKVIMVYEKPFWDEDRDIFGVLRNPTNRHSLDQKDYASQRGRFFQWFNITQTSGLPVLLALMAGDAGYDTEQSCNDDLVREATDILRSVYGSKVPEPIETVVTRWASDKFARGSYSSAGPDMKADDYDTMARPIGNLFFAGEHTSGTHPATVHGAYLSGLRAASEVLDAMLGPIEIPTPLIIPRESLSSSSSSSLKRKASENKDPTQARIESYEIALWDHVIAEIGLRPLKPPKMAVSAYIFYSKAHYEDARKKCELGRRPGKGKPSGNEIRTMSAKMWKELAPELKKPFEDMAEEQKKVYAGKMAEFNEAAAEWDRRATEIKQKYERENPPPPVNSLGGFTTFGGGSGSFVTEGSERDSIGPAGTPSEKGLANQEMLGDENQGQNQKQASLEAGEAEVQDVKMTVDGAEVEAQAREGVITGQIQGLGQEDSKETAYALADGSAIEGQVDGPVDVETDGDVVGEVEASEDTVVPDATTTEAEVDADVDADPDADADADLDIDADADGEADLDADGDEQMAD
ncbi:Sec1-like protein [Naviculisporaceae sp. PSN 640]